MFQKSSHSSSTILSSQVDGVAFSKPYRSKKHKRSEANKIPSHSTWKCAGIYIQYSIFLYSNFRIGKTPSSCLSSNDPKMLTKSRLADIPALAPCAMVRHKDRCIRRCHHRPFAANAHLGENIDSSCQHSLTRAPRCFLYSRSYIAVNNTFFPSIPFRSFQHDGETSVKLQRSFYCCSFHVSLYSCSASQIGELMLSAS